MKTLIWAFKVFVRPILEYASPVWSPHHLCDIDLVESVQRRFTKSIGALFSLSYHERRRMSGLDSLELRRLRADLYLTHSLLHRRVDFEFCNFFELQTGNRTRGHSLKLVVGNFRTDCRKFFFTNRVIKVWNALPDDVVRTSSLCAFKRKLSEFNLQPFLYRF